MDTRTSNDRKSPRKDESARENSKDPKHRRSPRRSETKHASDKVNISILKFS